MTQKLKCNIPDISSNVPKRSDIVISDSLRCLLSIAHQRWVGKHDLRNAQRNSTQNHDFWSKIVTFTTFWPSHALGLPNIAFGALWHPWARQASRKLSLSVRTTFFEQFGAILTHFKSDRIFKKKFPVGNFLAVFEQISAKIAKNADFSKKLWKFKFSEISKYWLKMHEIEVWWTWRVAFAFRIDRTRLRACSRWNFDACGELVRSTLENAKIRFSIARGLPRAHYGARSWSPSDEEFDFLHFITLHQVNWTHRFRCRCIFYKKTPNGLAWLSESTLAQTHKRKDVANLLFLQIVDRKSKQTLTHFLPQVSSFSLYLSIFSPQIVIIMKFFLKAVRFSVFQW